jgi:hypothetical protein
MYSGLCNPKWRSDQIWFRQIAEMSGAARLTDHSIEVKRGSLSTVHPSCLSDLDRNIDYRHSQKRQDGFDNVPERPQSGESLYNSVTRLPPCSKTLLTQPKGLFLGGTRTSGAEIRDANGEQLTWCILLSRAKLTVRTVTACQTVSNILKSSLGPVG